MMEEANPTPSMPAVQALVSDGAFEETLRALESVVEHLERGRLSIDESVTWYELGLGLSRRCTALLHQAELRIRTIEDRFAVAASEEDPWDDNGV